MTMAPPLKVLVHEVLQEELGSYCGEPGLTPTHFNVCKPVRLSRALIQSRLIEKIDPENELKSSLTIYSNL